MTASPPTPEWSARVREAFHHADLLGLTGYERTVLALNRLGKVDDRMGITTDPNDPELQIIDPENNQQMSYLVLSEDERNKGFVQPLRRSYVHEKCGSITTMGLAIAETYARNPRYYGATYCCRCQNHFPVGGLGEFVWDGTNIKVGTFGSTGE